MASFDIGRVAAEEYDKPRERYRPVKVGIDLRDLNGVWDWDAWSKSKGAPLMDRIQAALPKGSDGADARSRLFGDDQSVAQLDLSEDPALTTGDKVLGGEETSTGQKLGLALALAAGALGLKSAAGKARAGRNGKQAKAVEEIIDGIGKETKGAAKASAKPSQSLYDIYYGAEKGAGETVEQASKKAAKDAAKEAADDVVQRGSKGSKASAGEEVPVNKPKPEVPKSEPNGNIQVKGNGPTPEAPKGSLGWRMLKEAVPYAIGGTVVYGAAKYGPEIGKDLMFQGKRWVQGEKPMPGAQGSGYEQSPEKQEAETLAWNAGLRPGTPEHTKYVMAGWEKYQGRTTAEKVAESERQKMAAEGLKSIDMELLKIREQSRAADAEGIRSAYGAYEQAKQQTMQQRIESLSNWMANPTGR